MRIANGRALALLTALWCAAALSGAQDPPRFEVASVKREPPNAPILNRTSFGPAGFQAESASMSMIMSAAFDVTQSTLEGKGEPFRLLGRTIALYEISAKAAKPTPVADLKLMLQNLLVERFQLRYHWETHKDDELALTVSKSGLKIRPDAPSDAPPGTVVVRAHEVAVSNATLDALARNMAFRLDRPVTNQTGETGRFTFTLKDNTDGSSPRPSFMFTSGEEDFAVALRAIGTDLERVTVTRRHLVVDSILGTPSEN